MRSAADFDSYYRTSRDPWGIAKAHRRDNALARIIKPYVQGKAVLELGCGEAHLTATVFSGARQVRGVDISPVAIERASALRLPNASFETNDFLSIDFAGYDVIAAIECLCYLSPDEQEAFFGKLAGEHHGTFILSAPIIGTNEYRTYFTHQGLCETFTRHGLSVVEWRNLNAYRKAGFGGTVAAALSRLSEHAMSYCPERFVYQRCYVLQ